MGKICDGKYIPLIDCLKAGGLRTPAAAHFPSEELYRLL